MMKTFRTFCVAAAATALGAATALAADPEYRWDLPDEYSETSAPGAADKLFAEKVREKTNGRIEITNHFGGSLGFKSKDHWAAVEDGAIPLASTYTGVFGGIDPIFFLNNLPFAAQTPAESLALVRAAEPWYQAAFEKGNQMMLLASPWSPVGIWSKKKVTSKEDLAGLKIRTYDKTATTTLKNAGAAAIQLSWADVIPALSTGTIDAVLTSDEGGMSGSFWDYLDYFHVANMTMGTNMIHINKDVFNDLPEDLQKAVLEAARETEDEMWGASVARTENNLKVMKEKGVEPVTDLPPAFIEFLRESAQESIDDWRKAMGEEEADRIFEAYKKRLADQG